MSAELVKLLALVLTAGALGALDLRTKQEIKSQLLANYDASMRPNLALALADSRTDGQRCIDAEADQIKVQLFVDFLTVDQKQLQYTIEGFLRLWWDDPRLTFNGTGLQSKPGPEDVVDHKGCLERLVFRNAEDLWLPDVYFDNVVALDMGGASSSRLSSSIAVYPNGSIWWSRQVRITFRCDMLFGNLPFDTQECPIKVGLYSDTTKDARLQWRPGRQLLDNWEGSSTSTWEVVRFEQRLHRGEYHNAVFDQVVGVLFLQRDSTAYLMTYVTTSIFFVLMAYAGMWINPAAVPARVGLHAISVLVINNLSTALPSL